MDITISPNGQHNILEWATRYAKDFGWSIIAFEHGEKGPRAKGWNSAPKLEPEDVAKTFAPNGAPKNIGVHLGPVSKDLVDLDLDKPIAESAAAMIRAFASAPCYGHGDAPCSHRLFVVPGVRTRKILDTDGSTLLEIRAFNPDPDDSEKLASHQSVLPPSQHPDGTLYQWAKEYDPETVSHYGAQEFDTLVNKLATAVLIAQHMPPTGGRHNWALPLAGYLLRHLGKLEVVMDIMRSAWFVTQPSVSPDTLRELEDIVKDTAQNLASASKHTTGGGRLQQLSPGLPGVIAKVWGFSEAPGGAKAGKPTDDELRDRWISENPLTFYSREGWYCYDEASGLYTAVHEDEIKDSISTVLEEAKEEGIKPTANAVESVYKLARFRRRLPNDEWDADPDLLVLRNGTLKISTRELLAHSPDHYATTGMPYDYDPEAECPNWHKLLAHIDAGARYYVDKHYRELGLEEPPSMEAEDTHLVSELLQEHAGLSFTTDMQHEAALWLVGEPGSGKSTYIEGLIASIGEGRSLKLDLDDILDKYGYANIPGKTLLYGTEQPSRFLQHTNRIEALISGEKLTISQKYTKSYQARGVGKLVWAMNQTPKVANPNAGVLRRVLIVPFPLPPTHTDEGFRDAVKGEGSGILNWALDGLDRLRKRGSFKPLPSAVRIATEEFKQEADTEAQFVSDWCDMEKELKIRPVALYSGYRAWCKLNGYRAKSIGMVAKDWARLGYEKKQINGYAHYTGIDLKETAKVAINLVMGLEDDKAEVVMATGDDD